ncbi:MAG: acyl carrier protein [Coriobacteriales bacterium]|nr:acyl carrier protein [Coriobacteriales bacterium]
MAESTFEVVQRVLADGLSVDKDSVTMDADINEDLGADSLDAVELIMSLEEEFDIEIEPEKAESLHKVSDIVALIDEMKA